MSVMESESTFKKYGFKLGAAALVITAFAWQWSRIAAGAQPSGAHSAAPAPAPPPGVHAEGRLVTYPGAEVVVGTDVGGTIRSLPVLERTRVAKGALIAELDASEQRAALAEARARATEAEADVKFSAIEKDRSARLVARQAVAQDALDRQSHELDAARARWQYAAATARRLAAVVRKTRVTAPIDGVVVERFAEQGETVAPGARLVTLVDLARTRVEAEIDEYDAGRIAVGQSVAITAEGFTGAAWKGTVEEIPDVVTSRRIKPADPGRPSDTRVLLVKVALREPVPVKLGQRVEVEVQVPR
jgi:RND family efflux transporter MFP subunit